MSPAFLEWAYFVGVMAAFVAAVVLLVIVAFGLVLAGAMVFRFFRPSKESS